MAYDPYKDASSININDLDENGENIAQKQREQEKRENIKKDGNDKLDDEVASKLAFVKKLLHAKAFGRARTLLDEAEQAECHRVGSKGFCDNPEVYYCKVLLKYQARDEEDLISKQPDLDNDEDFLLAVDCCKTEEQRQGYQSVLDRINGAKKAEREQETENLKKQASDSAAKHKAELTAEEETRQKKLKRISRLIDAGEFDEARERLEKIEQDEEDRTGDCEIPQVYHYKMLLDYGARTDEELIATLIEKQDDITQNKNYRLAKNCAEDIEDDAEFDALLKLKKKATEGIAKAKAEAEAKAKAEAERKRKEEEERKKREEEERKRKAEAEARARAEAERKRKEEEERRQREEAERKRKAEADARARAEAERKRREEEERRKREEAEAREKAIQALWEYKDLGNGYINFGAYPQSKKASNVNIDIFDYGRGYYLGSDNCLYEKCKGDYYKVEPIKWKVLSRGGECFIVSDKIIDIQIFDNDSNNYANSDIRSWLNNYFYNKAFKDSQQSKIVTTNVDNSVSSTGDSSNEFVCGNTSDKVFLLSHKEAQQYFGGNESRRRVPTEYAVARGAYLYIDNSSVYKLNGKGCRWWWLRSPYCSNSNYAQLVCYDGSFGYGDVRSGVVGELPALKFKP